MFEEYKYKYDLHVHTSPVSPCGDFSPEEVVDKYEVLGYNGFVMTNHLQPNLVEKFAKPEEFAEYFLNDYRKGKEYGDKKGIDVILGIEIRFPLNGNDYLIYGVDESDVYKAVEFVHTDFTHFCKNFKSENTLIIHAHPFRQGCFIEDIKLLDGIEIMNLHPGHNSAIAMAAKTVFENPRLIKTGGTDFHHEGHEGMCATLFKERITDSFKLSDALREKDYILDMWGNKIVLY